MSLRVLIVVGLLTLVGCAHPSHHGGDTLENVSGLTRGVPISEIKVLPSDSAAPFVFVSREVRSRGRYTWVDGMTLTDLIDAAGGFTPYAGERIHIHHADGTEEVHQYGRIRKHSKNDPVLRPGDAVWVLGALG